MSPKTAAIILAGGKGTRTRLTGMNKVALPFRGKPLIRYAADLMKDIASPLVIVVGSYGESVREVLAGYDVWFVNQPHQYGTGHAARCGLEALEPDPPEHVLIGYGDHMMHYRGETIRSLLREHMDKKEALTIVVSESDRVNDLKYGRIIRNGDGSIHEVIEQKDATPEVLAVREFNAGFYCVRYDFLTHALPLITPSPVTGEYYITDLVAIAVREKRKVLGFHIPFKEVGVGVNTLHDMEISGKIE